MEFTAKQIADFLGGEVVGNNNEKVHTFAKIEEGTKGALSFLSNPKYIHYLYETKSSIVLINKDFEPEHPVEATLIKVSNAYESLAKLLSLYESMKPKRKGIDPLEKRGKAPASQNLLKKNCSTSSSFFAYSSETVLSFSYARRI